MIRIEASQGENGYASPEDAAGIIMELQDTADAYSRKIYKGARGNTAYGEFLPSLVTKILGWTQCGQDDVFFDIGSGIGNMCFQVAVQVGCSAYGIEIRKDLVTVMQEFRDIYTRIIAQRGLSTGSIQLMQGDITTPSQDALDAISRATVVVMNNTKWQADLNRLVFALLKQHLPIGARIVVVVPLVPVTRQRATRKQDDLERFFGAPEKFTTDQNDVSWGYKAIDMYMYTIATQPGVGLVCCMCPNEAQYVSGGVFYLCGKQCQRSLYN